MLHLKKGWNHWILIFFFESFYYKNTEIVYFIHLNYVEAYTH